MICAKCGGDAEPPNVREAFDFVLDDWVYIHKRCPSRKKEVK